MVPLSGLWGQSVYTFQERGRTHQYLLESQGKVPAERRSSSARTEAPLFYDRDELPSADRLRRMTARQREARLLAARRVLTNKLLLRLTSEEQWKKLQATRPAARESSVAEGWTVVRYRDPQAALAAVQWLTRQGGYEFVPLFNRRMFRRQSGTLQRAVTDPLFVNQWHLGPDQGIRMRAAWDVVTGKGINIAVIDDGVDIAHEDLAANAYPIAGGYHFNFNDGPDEDPSPVEVDSNHGTACAGIVAARGFNNLGVVGVAPEARIMGLRLIAGEHDDEQTATAFLWQPNDVVTHVSSNSWGPQDDAMDQGRLGELARAALEEAVTTHRGGLGTVFAFSAGNGRGEGDDSSYDEFSGNRFVISVGAVNRKGEPSSYSEAGMSVAVSALGGEFSPPETLWTTNRSGPESFALMKEKFETAQAPLHYLDAFNGTSAAAPQVSGAAALLLEHNPRLGYRDVKEILMRTARREGLSGADEFVRNGGNLFFSHSFGAGVIDVAAALETAATWTNLGPLQSGFVTAEGEAEIPDGSPTGATTTFDLSNAASLRIEHVELTVDVAHSNRGDLGFAIISPSGMVSIAEPREADEGEDFVNYTFTSVRHWGEDSAGVWRVRVIDTVENGETGTFQKATLRMYGTAK
jgi:subtilisin family serine protease